MALSPAIQNGNRKPRKSGTLSGLSFVPYAGIVFLPTGIIAYAILKCNMPAKTFKADMGFA